MTRKFTKYPANYVRANSSRKITAYTNNYYKDSNGKGFEWEEMPTKIFIDGEYGTYTTYSRILDNGWIVYITPKYLDKYDELVYQVTPVGSDPFTDPVESFETFYDAMDFVDSGELAYRMGW